MKPNAQGCHTLKKQKPTTKDNPPLTKLGFWMISDVRNLIPILSIFLLASLL